MIIKYTQNKYFTSKLTIIVFSFLIFNLLFRSNIINNHTKIYCRIILTILLSILYTNSLYSNIVNFNIDNNEELEYYISNFSNIDLLYNASLNEVSLDTNKLDIDTPDSTSLDTFETNSTNTVLRLAQEDFMIADNFRYTINGDLPLLENDIDALKFGAFAGAFSSFIAVQHIYQVNTIWSKSASFKFLEDGEYALYLDKVGHFYGAYIGGYLYSEFFMWSGMSYENATLTGSLLGLAYSTYVEIMDGFADNWGFSPSDFYSDLAGFSFFYLQHQVPWLQNITPKFIYYPAEWHGENSRKGSEIFIDDYSSQSFFLSFNIYNMLPDNYKQYWLPWLQLSIGYAARNLSDPSVDGYDPSKATKFNEGVAGSPKLIIGLDYDLVKLLPEGIPLWNWLRQTLNYFKLPSPAIEISAQGTKFMLLYPFISF